MSDRDELLRVINDKAVIRGDFVLSSGQHADWYIDLRRVLLSGASAALAGRV
ncbi:MAG TPA: orotate phosphoribosyltransferase, partial [Streptosporangiaceae bacterium]|nr:orotate phosphoribosyltransferase [Streptosporangiaceae bacterium]